MSATIKQTLYDWCIENDRQDVLDLWDYELNTKTPKEVGVRSSKKCWFKCPRGLHESELQYLCSFYETPSMKIYCNKCNSIAQFMIDKFGEQGFVDMWSDKNTLDPWEINKNSKTQVWVNCLGNPKHTHDQYVLNIYKGIGCPYCWGRRVLPEESVGALYPTIFDVWSDKNTKSPYEYSVSSNQKVWTKCLAKMHNDAYRSVADIVKSECRCGKCSRFSTGYPEDLTNVRFERLLVIGRDPQDNDRWLCVCDCQNDKNNPNIKSILRGHLTSGKIVSCGCYVREIISGENNRNWKGGLTSENDKIRQSIEYRNWQNAVKKRDKYTCQCCGKRYKAITVHHIFPFSDYSDLRFIVDNGICLCKDCHDSRISGSFHNVYGTQHNTPEQLREYLLNKANKDVYQLHPQILQLVNTIQNN